MLNLFQHLQIGSPHNASLHGLHLYCFHMVYEVLKQVQHDILGIDFRQTQHDNILSKLKYPTHPVTNHKI
ncbi:MAG TPA: hypothetical protein VIM16_02535 [Mucilaginibacter sp.]|jgi:hypothetical protein